MMLVFLRLVSFNFPLKKCKKFYYMSKMIRKTNANKSIRGATEELLIDFQTESFSYIVIGHKE